MCVGECSVGMLCGCVYGGSAVWMCVWRECCVDVCMEGVLCGCVYGGILCRCVYGGSAVWMCVGECSVGNAVWMCVWRESVWMCVEGVQCGECCVDVCMEGVLC